MTDRIIIGNIGGGEQGIKVSKPGVNVLTAATADLLFDSRTGYTRLLQRGTAYFPSGGQQSQVIPLSNTGGNAPVVVVYRIWLYLGQQYASIYPIGWTANATTTALTITRAYDEGYDYLIGYYVFADRGA